MKIGIYLRLSNRENPTHQNLWNAAKVVTRVFRFKTILFKK